MSDPLARAHELLATYGSSAACAAHLLCDRHDPSDIAFTIVDASLAGRDLTFGELRAESTAFAAGLAALGVGPGDRVATLMAKGRELAVALLGIWRLGAVHVPLFTAFAPPAIAMRLNGSAAKVVVTDPMQRSKLEQSTDGTSPTWRIVVAGAEPGALAPSDVDFDGLMRTPATADPTVAVGGDGTLVQLYTSGTTGRPKAVAVPVRAVAAFQMYLEYGLDVSADDVYWNAADPGWAYGLYYAIIAPLAAGRRSILVKPQFSARVAWGVIERFGVTNLAAAPTVYRTMRAQPPAAGSAPAVRRASSAGEPLTPDVNEWAPTGLGAAVHDHYGQTETGMVVNNHHHPDLARLVKPGSMGCTMPGFTVSVIDENATVLGVDQHGRIAIDRMASPLLWFGGYLGDPDRTAEKLTHDGRWYLTGDTGTIDADGDLRFSARDDDVIIMAGYRIGPFDIESVLATHPAVAECAVIAAPDPIRGEVIEAYVVLREGTEVAPAELQQLVRRGYGAHAYPRAVHFIAGLPKTESGKVQRHVLRAWRRDEVAGEP
jgi:acetyl-CoA synthetase